MSDMRSARALAAIHDTQRRLESVGVEPSWVAVPIELADGLGADPSTPDYTLFGMRVMWVDAEDPYVAVRAR